MYIKSNTTIEFRMIVCPKCKRELESSAFNKKRCKNKQDFILQPYCRECNIKTSREWYQQHKERVIKKTAESRQRKMVWFGEFKQTLKCNTCGEAHIACLDFHHNDPLQKEGNISYLKRSYGKKRIMEEISKCTILCANCHRKHHWDMDSGL